MESETHLPPPPPPPPPKLLHLPYDNGVSEQIEKMCQRLVVKTVMKTVDTLRS